MASTPTVIESPLAAGFGVGLLAVALWFAPPLWTQRVRGFALDALRPGLQAAHQANDRWNVWRISTQSAEVQRLQQELAALRDASRRDRERSQRLTAQLALVVEQQATSAGKAESGDEIPRLFSPALIDAAVLADSLAKAWRDGRILDRGWQHGLREDALVLGSQRPLIDVGRDAQISPEDTLLIGRTVVGKVEVVGRWTSTYLPVTDPDFRGRAQLVRDTASGPAWGAQGLLRGTGSGCRLDGIVAEETVRPGDLVYTADRDGIQSAPLCYGEVIAAELDPEGRRWDIEIRPAPTPSAPGFVQVLRTTLNVTRMWGP